MVNLNQNQEFLSMHAVEKSKFHGHDNHYLVCDLTFILIRAQRFAEIFFKSMPHTLFTNLSIFSANRSFPTRLPGILTCTISSKQFKMYFLASCDLILVSRSCSLAVYKRIKKVNRNEQKNLKKWLADNFLL